MRGCASALTGRVLFDDRALSPRIAQHTAKATKLGADGLTLGQSARVGQKHHRWRRANRWSASRALRGAANRYCGLEIAVVSGIGQSLQDPGVATAVYASTEQRLANIGFLEDPEAAH